MDVLHNGISTLISSINNNIPSVRQLLSLPLLLSPQLQDVPTEDLHSQQTCPLIPVASCPLPLSGALDTCCVNQPAGHFLLAQFWDSSPPKGPSDSWTLHGLWPDYCTGGFPQYCDNSRDLTIPEIVGVLDEEASTPDSKHAGLRAYMDTYWKGLSGDEHLWMHEWNKHGTCVSTLEPKCYAGDDDGDYLFNSGLSHQTSSRKSTEKKDETTSSHQDMLDYFTAATSLHSTLNTYQALAANGITPSTSKTYSLSDIQAALSASHAGFNSTVKCNKRGEVDEIWMHFVVLGSLRDFDSSQASGTNSAFVPVAPDGIITTCPKEGIKYLPKQGSGDDDDDDDDDSPQPSPPLPTSTQAPAFKGNGYLKIHVLDDDNNDENSSSSTRNKHQGNNQKPHYPNDRANASPKSKDDGCLISKGSWYTSGTCATYRVNQSSSSSSSFLSSPSSPSSSFTLQSRSGPCTILSRSIKHLGQKGEFVCSKDLPTTESLKSENNKNNDNNEFSSTKEGLLSFKGKTTFYADRRPKQWKKQSVFVDDDGARRRVKVQISWEGK